MPGIFVLAAADRLLEGENPVFDGGAGYFTDGLSMFKRSMDLPGAPLLDQRYAAEYARRDLTLFMGSGAVPERSVLSMVSEWSALDEGSQPGLPGYYYMTPANRATWPDRIHAYHWDYWGRFEFPQMTRADFMAASVVKILQERTVEGPNLGQFHPKLNHVFEWHPGREPILAASGKVMAFKSADTLAAWADCVKNRAQRERGYAAALPAEKRAAWASAKVQALHDYAAKYPNTAQEAGQRAEFWGAFL